MSYRKQGVRHYSQKPRARQLTFDKGVLLFKEPFFTFFPKYKYWSPKQDLVPNGYKWGFDITTVKSKEAWEAFLTKNKFKLVEEKQNTRDSHPRIYMNSDSIWLVTSNEWSAGANEEYSLGYVRFEAPTDKTKEFKKVLSDFRGPKEVKRQDVEEPGGITTYVKEESPNEAPFV